MPWNPKNFGGAKAKSKTTCDSLEELLFIEACKTLCTGTSCSECGKNIYESCAKADSATEEFLKKWLSDIAGESLTGIKAQIKMYEIIASGQLKICVGEAPRQEASTSNDQTKTCVTCLHSLMHTSGIRFCKSFGNFVHEDGFCYRYDSGKIEKKEDDQKTTQEAEIESNPPEENEVEFPF